MRRLILILTMLIMGCHSKQVIDIQGHRGCRGLLPENSLPAFKNAIALGVQTLELDVVITKDKQVIVSHEPFISRKYCLDSKGNEIPKAMDMKYNLYQMTFDSIKEFDCGTKFHKDFPEQEKMKVYKPLLSEVFEMAEALNKNIKYNIEIKSNTRYDDKFTPKPKEFVQLVLDVVEKYKVSKRTNLQAFDLRALEDIRKQDAIIKVALLVDCNEVISDKLAALSYVPEIISPCHHLLNKKVVEDYQSQGYKIIPWTLNTVEDLQKMVDFKVDGIITDYPDRLIEILNE